MDRPRPAVAALAAVVAALCLVGGGLWSALGRAPGAGPSTSSAEGRAEDAATREEFCAQFGRLLGARFSAMQRGEEELDFGAVYADYGRRVGAVGLPLGAPARVEPGFEVFVSTTQSLPAGITAPEEVPGAVRVTPAEDEAYRVFDLWARRQCHLPM